MERRFIRLDRGHFRHAHSGKIYSVRWDGVRMVWRCLHVFTLAEAQVMGALKTSARSRTASETEVLLERASRLVAQLEGLPSARQASPGGESSQAEGALSPVTLEQCWLSWQKTWTCAPSTCDVQGFRWRMLWWVDISEV